MGYYLAIPILALVVAYQSSLLPNVVQALLEGVLQASILPGAEFYVARPDLVLLLVLSWAVHSELDEAIFWAFTGGILRDLMSVVPVGTSVLGLLLLIFAINILSRNFYQFSIFFLLFFVVVGTFLQHFIVQGVLAIGGYSPDFSQSLPYFTLPTLLYNVALVLPIYFVLRRIQKRIPRPQSPWDVNPR